MDENPYIDEKLNNKTFVRKFKHDVLNEELVWHRDVNNRIVEVLEGEDWEYQSDNMLPKKLIKGDKVFIPAKTYHRLKRGTTDLKVKIEEF